MSVEPATRDVETLSIWPETRTFDVRAARRCCVRLRKRILEMSQTVPALHIV